ncbi:MAG TPA: rhodanese-like domain-containing protein [Desulfobulbus sp.]|nr:rhodanese-like domain-containing protein [Desulfobulbus sp.]
MQFLRHHTPLAAIMRDTVPFLLALILAAVTATAAPPPARTGDQRASLLGAANDVAAGKYARAADAFRRLLARDGHSPALWRRYDRAVVAAAAGVYAHRLPANRYRISPATLNRRLSAAKTTDFLLDVREPAEFARGHIPGSVNIPFREVLDHLDRLPMPQSGRAIVIICQTQHRANHVLVALRELGYSNAFTLQGGYHAFRVFLRKARYCAPRGTGTKGPAGPYGGITVIPLDRDAATAMDQGKPQLAVDILRERLVRDSGNPILWKQYERAVLTLAAQRYLHGVPDDRYRIDIDAFVTSVREHRRRFALVDVRTPGEFKKAHLRGSINLPLATLPEHLDRLPRPDSTQTILLVSDHQRRAIHALVILRELGYRAFTLRGGLHALTRWMDRLPAIEGGEHAGKRSVPAAGAEEEEEEDWGC